MNRYLSLLLLLFTQSALGNLKEGKFCDEWGEVKKLGTLSIRMLREASGMAVSSQFADRIYWVNDSGDGGRFYYTSLNGENTVQVEVHGMKTRDTEALVYTTCPEGNCLLLGDIGDNKAKRKGKTAPEVITILERETYPNETPILRRFRFRYPDGPRDAEAMSVTPTGDLIIVSKEFYVSFKGVKIESSRVYKIAKADWQSANNSTLTLTKIGELPLEKWFANDSGSNHVVTDMAINLHRGVVGLLTYGTLIEFPLANWNDLSKTNTWKEGIDFKLVPIRPLIQQESMAYLPREDTVLWSTEFFAPSSPLFSMTCKRSLP